MISYHTVTDQGFPMARIFVNTARDAGFEWTFNASHELLELLVDPRVNLSVVRRTTAASVPKMYMYEICDPVSSLAFGYKIPSDDHEILVSDFVYPAWFNEAQPINSNSQFDFGNHIHSPFTIGDGGYASVYDGSKWSTIWR